MKYVVPSPSICKGPPVTHDILVYIPFDQLLDKGLEKKENRF